MPRSGVQRHAKTEAPAGTKPETAAPAPREESPPPAVAPVDGVEARYRQVLSGLNAFRRVGDILAETFEIDEICDRAVRIFVEELGFENASILLLADDGKTLRLTSAAGKGDAGLSTDARNRLNRGLTMKVGEGVAGQVVATGKMILVPDVSKSDIFSARETSVTVKSLLCLPIVSKSRAVGAMNLSHPRIEEASENLKEVLQVLSSMVGQVVTIARLSSDLFRAKMVRSERLAGVGQLAASVVHEINNPLTNVMLRAQKIELDASASDGVKKTAEEIEEAGKKISRIVNRLLDYTRARESSREPMNVHAVLEEALAMTQSFVSSCGGIRVVREFSDPETFPQVVADTGCLEQVFTNLVINAALALKDRGRGTITIRTEALSDGVAIEFADDGIGIPPENVEKIFQPFFTTRSESDGTGLGLFVCRDIVHDHDGTISVRSRPGEGSVFRITLPFGSEQTDEG